LNTIAILTAAGSGKRFSIDTENNLPKQFVKLLGKPVILYSLITLQKCSFIKQIVVSSNKEYFDLIHSFISGFNLTKLTTLVEGGKTRFDSVKNAFTQISANDTDLILIHDAARPNINTQLCNRIIQFAKKHGNTVIATKITDTVKREKRGTIKETVNREYLWTVQTPQVFRYSDLKKSYKKNRIRGFHTDESSMVESAGFKVNLFLGSNQNIKLTTKEDIKILQKLLK
jgi:2-C-methyl-D-erythritol 4-phosphate cytidylyltransferase